ncbi:CopG family transcriptional regulator [Pyrolobus fumarii]|uniref:type II toxin-antitoxin system VapB family antitoxin n=1 Tax=Pyrolobus fumarii TaxID=54252 RepID=UPI001432E8D3|nr:CopG family transcriptional regulator [Pyrolobus fumarii]
MSEVLSIRVPRDLKKRMMALRDVVDWRREIIAFLEERVRYYERLVALREAEELLRGHPVLPRGMVVRMVREDRDSG